MIARAFVLREVEGYLCVLLVKTSSGNRYIVPGGHGEQGESVVKAAERETLEEVGYQVVGFSREIGRYETPDGGAMGVVFKGAEEVGAGERVGEWVRIEGGVRVLQVNRTEPEWRGIVGALRRAVRVYCGPEELAESGCVLSQGAVHAIP